MKIRRRTLPPGWYPTREDEARSVLDGWNAAGAGEAEEASVKAVSCVAPHAGWMFSGRIAFDVISLFSKKTYTVVVVGGHLPPGAGIMAAFEDAYETPLGPLEADRELLSSLQEKLHLREDSRPDNTVEVQLPLVKFLLPGAKALWLRAAPSGEALTLGSVLAEYMRDSKRTIAVLGSTDLTHYGFSYGFSPKGSGHKAEEWVKKVNDKRFIDALLDQRTADVLSLAAEERSACSAGGAAAASSFALSLGINKGRLLRYSTSLEVHKAESFVGYAGIVYEPK